MANPRGFSQSGIELLYAELAKRGISPAAASGAIAGVMGESGGNLDPTSFNTQDPGGGSGGIGQWNRGRLVGPNGMLTFAKDAGVPVDVNNPLDAKKVPLNVQAQYLGHELDTTYSGVTAQLRAAKTPQDALGVWVNSYENPADKRAAIAQRSQYLAPVGQTLNSLPSSGAPAAPADGPPAPAGAAGAPAAPGQPGQAPTGLAGSLPGFQPNSPGAKMTAKGLEDLSKSGSPADNSPAAPSLPTPPPPMATGGQMMMGPGGQNTLGRSAAEQWLAQQGFLMRPQIGYGGAATSPVVPSSLQSMPISQATGIPTGGLPGTTLNSPSQLQMALMSGQLSPYDLYANGYGAGLGSQ